LSENERVLLRALASSQDEEARHLAATKLTENPQWLDGLASSALLEALANAAAHEPGVAITSGPAHANPLDLAPDEHSRNLLAGVLLQSEDPGETNLAAAVADALSALERRALERRQRELRTLIAEADRKGDQAMVSQLTQELQHLNRTLRGL